VAAFLLVSAGAVALGSGGASAAPPDFVASLRPQSMPEQHHDVSRPLRDLPPAAWNNQTLQHEHAKINPPGASTPQPDGALQSTAAPSAATTAGLSFAGVGYGDHGFVPDAAPPDTTGAVGASQYVQWVNESFAVFDKATGALLAGPLRGNTLWSGFGGGCQNNNDGDPIVAYDKAAGRWVLTQFSVSSPGTYGYLQCDAVTKTSDATGQYNRYSFSYGGSAFNDYPKLGVWPDGYYISYNIFTNGRFFAGSKICALNRDRMLAGLSATQQCGQLSSSYGNLLPTDLDGSTAPPAGAPNVFASFGANSLNTWRFHVDWNNTANSSITGPFVTPVAGFSTACGGGACIPQPGTSQRLDSLADRLMYRLAYRNFGDHQSWVVNHSVTAGSSVGVRWYELRSLATAPTVYQQGTYAPTSDYRWMGSVAMDKVGNIAAGYSIASTTRAPSIAFATRAVGDPLGTLGNETIAKDGGGSQTTKLERWGDYSTMTLDPRDDCTFWYSTEYLKSSGTFNWSTWITSFQIAGCTSSVTPTAPATPTGLQAVAGTHTVGLAWNASSGATSYDVLRRTSGGTAGVIGTPTGTSFSDTDLTNGTTYLYSVRAKNSAGVSAPTTEVPATPSAPATVNLTFSKSCGNATCSFDASASTGISAYSWAFSDSSQTATGVTTSHTYSAAGTWTVTLTGSYTGGSTTKQATVTCSVKKNRRLNCA
jgi:hypothetical protein